MRPRERIKRIWAEANSGNEKQIPGVENQIGSFALKVGGIDVGKVDDGGEFLFVMFDYFKDAGFFIDLDVAGEGGGDVLVVHGDEAGEGHAGKGKGAHGFVDLVEVLGEETGLVGVLHEVFDVIDDVVDIEKLGTLERGGVADACAFEVETMFEGVEVAWLSTAPFLCKF